MTIEETIANLKRDNPSHRFAHTSKNDAIAVFSEGTWVGVASRIIGDEENWYPMPRVLANGQPLTFEWIEAVN